MKFRMPFGASGGARARSFILHREVRGKCSPGSSRSVGRSGFYGRNGWRGSHGTKPIASTWSFPRGLLNDGRKVTKELFRSVLDQELVKVRRFAGDKFDTARDLFDQITTNDEFVEFLTLPGYDKIN